MRWRGRKQSGNVEDRRGQRLSPAFGHGGPSLLPLVMRLTRSRGGWLILIAGVAFLWLSGADIGALLGLSSSVAPQVSEGRLEEDAAERELVAFMSVVLVDTDETWHAIFTADGQRYAEPRLVLFRGATNSACGLGQAAMGPFYCPLDKQIYDEALGAASAIGDDRLQRQTQGQVVPDSFTHGTSAQRARWFRIGYERGSFAACDTFAAKTP